MINADMRLQSYSLIGALDEYGQESFNNAVAGSIKIAIYETSKSVQDDIRYKDATYIGLTHELINDSYVINYGSEKLKVLYVYPKGRLKQVFMKAI